MRATIQYIEQELSSLYPKMEIKAFTRLLLEQVCGLSYTSQLVLRDQVLQEPHRDEIIKIVERLKKFEPIQYILGETEFLGMRLMVTPSVLIPRPETEELVQWIAETEMCGSGALLDLCTGSGCIALGLKKIIPNMEVQACDNSSEALEVARKNAFLNKLGVDFFNADIMVWENMSWNTYDIIVSNPPYVRESEKATMAANVLNYEPEAALFVPDSNPLQFYRRIAEFASQYLKQNGWLFFEINEHLGNEMTALIEMYEFSNIEIKTDLSGKKRMLRCCKGKCS